MSSAFDRPAIDRRQPVLSEADTDMHIRVIDVEYITLDPVVLWRDCGDWTMPGK